HGASAFFFSSSRRHTRWPRDWSSDVCSSDLAPPAAVWSWRVVYRSSLAVTVSGVGLECWSFVGDGAAGGADAVRALKGDDEGAEIGRASCRERGRSSGGAGAVEGKTAGVGEG